MKNKKALLYGIGSYRNRGGEALVASTLNLLDQKYDEVYIASYDLSYNTNYYNTSNHHYINHYRYYDELESEEKMKIDHYNTLPFDYQNYENIYQKQVMDAMDEVDICISSGGDNYCYGSSTWLYALLNAAKSKGKPSVLWGASLFETIDDIELIDSLNQFDLLFIRESITYQALEKYIPEEKLLLAPDPAFGLSPKKIKIPSWYQNREVIGINLSPLTIQNEEQYQSFEKFIDYILNHTKYSIAFIPHVLIDGNDDREILDKLYQDYKENDRVRMENVEDYQYQEIKYLISNFRFVIAARTHLSISSYSNFIPTLVIGYSVKSRGIAKDLFGEYDHYVLSKDELSYDRLISCFSFLEKNQDEIVKILKQKMKEYVPKAKNLLNLVLERLEENEKMSICGRDNCVGCAACYQACPHHAIEMKEDDEGFLMPVIDREKCTSCHLCQKVCPVLNRKESEAFQPKCYATKNKDKEVLKDSSSGGIFSILAQSFLKSGGVVYGAFFDAGSTYHIRIDDCNDLYKIRGSKYMQSSLVDVFSKIKKDLEEKREVLFSGTPCQISAIKSFLKKEYANLYSIGVICHGVINEKLWKKYADEIGIAKENYQYFNFRDKGNGWNIASVSYFKNDKKKVVEFLEDPLMYLYLKNYIFRKSCYQCKFKGLNHIQADIMLGDYWGIHLCHPEFFDKAGISSVIINSKKGEKLLKESNFFEDCEVLESKIDYIYEYNTMLAESIRRPVERSVIFDEMKYNEFIKISQLKKAQNENKILKEELEKQSWEAQNAKNIVADLQAELDKIYYSRRWRIPTKIIDTIKRKK